MADSDNNTTLPAVTRRRSVAGGASTHKTRPFDGATPPSQSSEASHKDPTPSLCEKWQEARNHTLALCRKHQALEAELVRVIGFPNAQPSLPGRKDRKIRSVEGLPKAGPPEGGAIHNQASAELDDHQARWDALDHQIGYSRMDGLIRQSEAAERSLMDDILLSPASTMDGMLAKLSVILCEAENRDDPEDFPWPHLRALRNDLTRLRGAEEPTIARARLQSNSTSS